MPELSPAAQAVLDAVVFSKPGLYSGIAAALRAAAEVMPIQELTREPPDEFEQGLSQGQALARAELLAWADELESVR